MWILSYVTCCFEGTNFLVLFYWPGLLKQAHRRDHPDEAAELPYGVIFAAFMAAMIVGAWSFNRIVRGRPLGSTDTPRGGVVAALRALLSPNALLAVVMLIAGASLFVAVRVTHEICVYLAFLVFEVCNGVYLPSIAYQRGLIVKETNRAGLYGLIKLPLYIVVIVALCTTGEGTSAETGDMEYPLTIYYRWASPADSLRFLLCGSGDRCIGQRLGTETKTARRTADGR